MRLNNKQLLELPSLCEGETVCCTCPACGRSKFYVSVRDGVTLYCCHRASCGARGMVGANPHNKVDEGYNKPKSKYVPHPDRSLNIEEIAALTAKFPWWVNCKHLSVDRSTKRVLLPLSDHNRENIGYVSRHWPDVCGYNTRAPKALVWLRDPNPPSKLGFMRRYAGEDTAYLFEDWVSAERVNLYTDKLCIILGGTSISSSDIVYLRKLGIKHLVTCLDTDARHKAAVIQKQCAMLFSSVTTKFWDRDEDPKDMDDDYFSEVFL